MNRTANCIKLLVLLRARGKMATSEIAEALDTNPRNVREYVRELQDSGYMIESIRGAQGGYRLEASQILPPLPFDEGQIQALRQARDYFRSDPGFAFKDQAASALDLLICQSRIEGSESVHHVMSSYGMLLPKEKEIVQKFQKAISEQATVEFSYQSLKQNVSETRRVNPYELVCSEGRWYLIGYDLNRHAFRNFRISVQRLGDVWLTMDQFIKDPDFRLKDHIGEGSIIRQPREYFKIAVKNESIRPFQEIDWGEELKKISAGAKESEFVFYSSHPSSVLRKLTRFGENARLLLPKARVEEYTSSLKRILANYE